MNAFFAQAATATPAPAPAPAAAAAPATPAITAAPAAPAAEAGTVGTGTEVQPAGSDAAPARAPQPQGGGFSMMWPMLILFALFYIMMIKPQQRKEKERRKMIEELRAGAKVMFAGGFIGEIVEAKEKTFAIELSKGVVVEVDRGAVQNVMTEAPASK